MTEFIVATTPDGDHRWWLQDESIPASHHSRRAATEAEAKLIRQILTHDRAGRMPPVELGDKLGQMFKQAAATVEPGDMTELDALRQVAQAAREILDYQPDRMKQPASAYRAWGVLKNAVDRMQFHHAPRPPGETVQVRAAVVFYCDGSWIIRGDSSFDDRDLKIEATSRGRRLSAIITARIPPLPAAPLITATVEPGA
ncbi:hypothetical protein [Sandarakinorhabdus sp.]|uniref:hypothetical protein n=1 Tax=Sandarakinorhabdus sp. TaxID=1916663 RepID=UPI003563626A